MKPVILAGQGFRIDVERPLKGAPVFLRVILKGKLYDKS
jgi:hypothetical protein